MENSSKNGYYKNPDVTDNIVNDITLVNPIEVSDVFTPSTQEELIAFMNETTGPVCIGGGRFSMGGQTASSGTTHVDMRQLNRVVNYIRDEKTIRVESGMRWCDIQGRVDLDDLSVKIMQTYANFTVGGSLSVNVHGRYIGLGPLILSVNSISVLLPSGEVVEANRIENYDVFTAAIGGYSFVGIILEVELQLSDNVNVKRVTKRMTTDSYLEHFKKDIRDDKKVIFHNADLYSPKYSECNSISWVETDEKTTTKDRLQNPNRNFFLEKYYYWVFSETRFGKWRREHLVDPILYFSKKVHPRNFEAGYSVEELEPSSREKSTYALQEYFVPVDSFDEFTLKIGEIYRRFDVNIINISIRHAFPDTESNLSWAREECFAFVVYYKQKTDEASKNAVAIWHREIMNLVGEMDGSYYLPYQPHATFDTFKKAYPNYEKTFALKQKLDPNNRMRNVLVDKYYSEFLGEEAHGSQYVNTIKDVEGCEFRNIFSNTTQADKLFLFLQNVYHIYPEKAFFNVIKNSTITYTNDKAIYTDIQKKLKDIKPFLSDIFYGLPALKKQKNVIIEQLLQLIDTTKQYDGYLEIGTTGRHINDLKENISLTGEIYTTNYSAPDNSPGEIFERGQLKENSKHFPLNDYEILTNNIEKESVDLVFMPIGIHHIEEKELFMYIKSIHDVLRTGGTFVLRDHNAHNEDMVRYCSNIHTVFNLGLNVSYEDDKNEYRNFQSIEYWIKLLDEYGFKQEGLQLLQDNDPSLNTLLAFRKI